MNFNFLSKGSRYDVLFYNLNNILSVPKNTVEIIIILGDKQAISRDLNTWGSWP